jgi:hypothetical protein
MALICNVVNMAIPVVLNKSIWYEVKLLIW